MALTRGMLKGMGLTDEQINAVIEAHTEVTNALKDERDQYKEEAEKLPGVQKELDDLKKDGGDWKAKYEKEHKDFADYKADQEAAAGKQSIEKAYRELLKECKVSEKRIDSIMKIADLSKIELDKEGKIKDSDKVTEGIKEEWSDFIESSSTSGARTETPPGGSSGKKMTKEEILKITDPAERQKAIADNHEQFGF